MQPENGKGVKPRFNLSTKVVYYDSNSIPPLPGRKKSYQNAKPRVNCLNKSMTSAECQVKKDNDDVKRILTSPSESDVVAHDEKCLLDNFTEMNHMNARIGLPGEETINALPENENRFYFDEEVLDLESNGVFCAAHRTPVNAEPNNRNMDLPDEDSNDVFSYAQTDRENESEINIKIFEFFERANAARLVAGYKRAFEYFQNIENLLLRPCKDVLFWKSIQPYINCLKAEVVACMGKTSEALQLVENVLADPNAIRFYDYAILIRLACKYFLAAECTDGYDDPDGVDDLGNLRESFDEFIQFSKKLSKSYDFFEDLTDFGNVCWGNVKSAHALTRKIETSMEGQENKLLYRLLNLDLRKEYSKEDFKKAYKVKLIKYHSDKFIGEPQELIDQCERKRQFIEEAYWELLEINGLMEESDDDFREEDADSDILSIHSDK